MIGGIPEPVVRIAVDLVLFTTITVIAWRMFGPRRGRNP